MILRPRLTTSDISSTGSRRPFFVQHRSLLKARRIGELRTVVFGARSYFAKHGRPRHPDELALHHCILRIADDPEAERWPFRIGGRKKSVPVRGRFRTDSAAVSHAAVAAGLGIGRAPLWQIKSLLDIGVVEVILDAFETAKTPIHIVWPPVRFPLARAKLFTELLATRLKGVHF